MTDDLFGEKKITGYTIYNAEQDRRTVRNDLPEFYPDLPEKKYDIIYADPPWDYGGKMQFDKSSASSEKIDLSKNIFISAANFKYPTVKTKDLKKIPLNEIAKDDCLLFMWVTNPHLAQGIELGKAWGFDYKTVAFVWDKMVHNPGQYTMSYCELCLVFKKGRIPKPRGARNVKQLVRVPRTKHSEKPLAVLEGINEMFPTQDKIEIFARDKPKGWDVWGLDVREICDEGEKKMKDNFLKNMFHDLNDISHGTDDEVTAELEAMGVDVEGAKKRFEETIKKCRAKATFNIRLDDEQLKSIAEKIARLEASENSARVRLSYVESELEALKCCGNCAGWENEKLIDGCDQLVRWKQSWDRCDRWEKRK